MNISCKIQKLDGFGIRLYGKTKPNAITSTENEVNHVSGNRLSLNKQISLHYEKEKCVYFGIICTFSFMLLIGISPLGYFNNYSFAQICPEPNLNDRDGDSIPNVWEIKGLDINQDNITDIDLPGLGADPLHKDIFVEVDYMKDRKPTPKALNLVVSQFDHAPLCNPDGITGISLHIQVDEEIPNERYIDIKDLKKLKSTYLGTLDERNNTNKDNIHDAKDLVFYYSLFADTHKHPKRYSGQADGIPTVSEPSSKTFMVTLGEGWTKNPQTGRSEGNVDEQSGTFMHELGHSLGLTHGGDDHGHYKPNYLSVMNYAFQVSSLIGNRSLDYSRCTMTELNENNLSETNGMSNSCPQDMNTISYARGISDDTANCQGPPEMVPTGKPIDWNKDNDAIDQDVKRDINCDNDFTRLGSHDNWNGIVYPLDDNSATAGGFSPKEIPELTHENVTAHRDLIRTDTVEGIRQVTSPEPDPTMGLGTGSDTINSTALEIVKDSAVRTLTSNATDQGIEDSQDSELNMGFNSLIHNMPPQLTQNEDIDQEISVMREIQSNLSSIFENSTINTRNVTGELEAQQNIDNMIQILEKQKWQ